MNSIIRLQEWVKREHTVRVAIVGSGFVGKGLVHRLTKVRGMEPALVVNRTVDKGVNAYISAGYERKEILISDNPGDIDQALADGRPVVSSDSDALTQLKNIDVVFEATGSIDFAAKVMLDCLKSRKHVVSMNAELDATIGYLLHHTAKENGVVYTISDGDQPGVILRQLQFVEGMGLEVKAVVNCKRYLDPHQTPQDSGQYANRDAFSVLMATAFGDGTKMNIEQCVLANITGLLPDCRGMHGVETTLANAATDIMAALSVDGAVEYTLGGDFGAGVGVIGYADHPDLEMLPLRNYKMGDGPNYFFFRPYHLVHFEAPFSIAEVVVDNMGLGVPCGPPVSEVVALAKQDLQSGTKIEGIGGASCYGQVDTIEGASGLLPIGIAEHARLRKNIRQDEPLMIDDVDIDETAYIVQLRKEQEKLINNDLEL